MQCSISVIDQVAFLKIILTTVVAFILQWIVDYAQCTTAGTGSEWRQVFGVD